MNNKKLFVILFISFILIFSTTLIIFSILGNKNRIGYLGEFKFDESHINNTLELNGLNVEETKKIFTIDDKLDNDVLINYIFTNESITNYSYGFRLKYYDKIFRNSDIYSVYIDTNKVIKDNNFIKEIKILESGSPFGNLISDKKIDLEKIDNISYILKIKPKLIIWFLFVIFIIFIIYNYDCSYIKNNKKLYHSYLIYKKVSEKYFVVFTIIISALLFLIHFYIGFPGYFHNPDNIVILRQSILKDYSNWHPVIIAVTLNFLYKIFGQNTFYITLINLLCLYSGMAFIVIALYMRYKKTRFILLFLVLFIADIYFPTLTQLKDITCSMFIWLSISLIFFLLIETKKNKILNIILCFIIFISLFLALLWRHNAIVTIYPIILFLIFLFTSKLKLKSKIKNVFIFLSISFFASILLVLVVKVNPYIWIKSNDGYYYKDIDYDALYSKYGYIIDYFTWMDINDRFARNAPNNIFAIQIAACACVNNDDSMIPDDWYEKGKTFEDLKNLYNSNPSFADPFVFSYFYNRIFKPGNLENIDKVWLKYILKYPKDYIIHILRFSKTVIFKDFGWSITSFYLNDIPQSLEEIGFKNYNVMFNDARIYIYNLFHNLFINIPITFWVVISIVLFFSSLFLIIKNKILDKMLLYSFFLSFSSLATIIIVVFFTPINDSRYIFPIIPINIVLIICFSLFIEIIYRNKGNT